MKPTARQKQICRFIASHQRRFGASPTCSEIQKHFGFRSPRAVTDHLRALERKKLISRRPGKSRSIRLAGSPGVVRSNPSLRAFKSASEIPENVKLALIMVPPRLIAREVNACTARGMKGVLVVSGGHIRFYDTDRPVSKGGSHGR